MAADDFLHDRRGTRREAHRCGIAQNRPVCPIGSSSFTRGCALHTRIGTIALAYLAETGGTSIGYADTAAQLIIAERADWAGWSAERLRLELLAALDRDERFAKTLPTWRSTARRAKCEVYHRAGTPPPAPPAPAVSLPRDPWRRRLFSGRTARHRSTRHHGRARCRDAGRTAGRTLQIAAHAAGAHHHSIWTR